MLRKHAILNMATNLSTPKSYPKKTVRANAGPSLYVVRLEQRIVRLEQRIQNQEERIRKLEQLVESVLMKS